MLCREKKERKKERKKGKKRKKQRKDREKRKGRKEYVTREKRRRELSLRNVRIYSVHYKLFVFIIIVIIIIATIIIIITIIATDMCIYVYMYSSVYIHIDTYYACFASRGVPLFVAQLFSPLSSRPTCYATANDRAFLVAKEKSTSRLTNRPKYEKMKMRLKMPSG